MYEWVSHTSEVELRVAAPTPQAVFEDATEALAELLGDATGAERSTRGLRIEAADLAGQLAAWLEELVFIAEHDALIPVHARAVELTGASARGTLECLRGRPSYLVKAVTYHRLAFEQADGGWHATVVLDV